MSIRVAVPLEPLSPESFALNTSVLVVGSDAARVLQDEMRRYCEGQTRGRSFLVAGHRGSGKTTMVEHAFLDLWKEYAKANATIRPLRVLLPGPSLLGEAAAAPRPADGRAAGAAKPAPAGADGGKAGARPAGAEARQDDASPDGGEPKPGAAASGKDGAAGGKDGEGAAAGAGRAREVVANALIQVTLGLHRAASQAFAEAYRQRALERIGSSPRLYADLPEMAAQLEVELFEGIRPARLREFWARGDFVSSGVLFPQPKTAQPDSRGARELLALAGVCEAYRRISGALTAKEKETDAARSETSASVASAEKGTELMKGLAALLTGGIVGGGVLPKGGPVAALAAGLATALGAAAVLRYSVARSRSRGMDREVEFVMDLSVQTLDRVLPIIVERLRAAGLPPIFVVDELDKVDNLSRHIENLVTHLKKFVSESAFFCFLTDRSYFEGMQARSRRDPYSKEYTYFSHQLFVAHRPDDLHAYLGQVLQREGDEARADAEILEYIALHRAEMHTVDVLRVLARWRGPGGALALPPGAVRTAPAYRLDLRAQIAVEIVLDGPELTALLEREPLQRQLVYDALYYPARMWKAGRDLDLGEAAAAGEFRAYLETRIGRDEVRPDEVVDHVSVEQAGRLLAYVRAVARLLADDQHFLAEFSRWDDHRERTGRARVSAAVREALRVEAPTEMLALLEPGEGEGRFRWRYTTAGLPVAAREDQIVVEVEPGWDAAVSFIRQFQQALREVAA
ncbi:MAG TPA: hypothetical protein VF746_27660 [Longimicrobium sp.]